MEFNVDKAKSVLEKMDTQFKIKKPNAEDVVSYSAATKRLANSYELTGDSLAAIATLERVSCRFGLAFV